MNVFGNNLRDEDYMRESMRNKKAFTLIELLVVISIIALLMGVLLPSLAKARTIAKRTLCGSNIRQIGIATEMYTSDYDYCYPASEDAVEDPKNPGKTYFLWMGRGFRGIIKPYLDNQEGRTSVLCCPGDKTQDDKYDATSYGYSMSFYHSVEQINSIKSVAGTYANPQEPVLQRAGNAKFPSQKIIYGEWYSNHEHIDNDGGWWCFEGTRNFIFVDGHIDYIKAIDLEKGNSDLPDPNLTINGIKGFDYKGQ